MSLLRQFLQLDYPFRDVDYIYRLWKNGSASEVTRAEAPGNFLRMISGSLEKRWHKIPARLSSRKIREIENEK
jgi:hypothetical protein